MTYTFSNLPQPMTYTLHILYIKLWEWEGIKEQAEVSIVKNGPNEHDYSVVETATERIKELTEAIEKLKQ
jgi:hypothetical protein